MNKGHKRQNSRKISFLLLSIFLLSLIAFGAIKTFKVVDTKYPWLWMYLHDQIQPEKDVPIKGPKHIMFLFVDHWEPHDQATVDRWMKDYPLVAEKHVDHDGKHPQHSFFWFFSHSDLVEKKSFLKQLASLVYQGFGEIELHLHHANDTEETFLKQMNEAIQLSKEVGAFVTGEIQPRTTFGFIHGMWALDNSRGRGDCGVNNELILLRRLGCYADFTNPSWGPMHSRVVNRLYYATDDPLKPKSYDRGIPMEVGKPGVGDLLMFTGQSVAKIDGFRLRYDHGEIDREHLPTPKRVDSWVRKAVHVKGKPEWIFIKVFAHGAIAQDHEAVLGKWRDEMHTYLESRYNDGVHYVLHYVTAREAYNIAKAAEAGKTGNPNDYRDFVIPPYVNRFMTASVSYEVISFDSEKAVLRFMVKAETKVELNFHASDITISGDAVLESLKPAQDGTQVVLMTKGEGPVGFTFKGEKK